MELIDVRPFILSLAIPNREMTRAQAIGELNELLSVLPERLNYFRGVLAGDGIDFSQPPEHVLDSAGQWLISRASLVPKKSTLPAWLGKPKMTTDISIPTMSACCYLGYLFGDYLIRDIPGLHYDLVIDEERNVFYQKPCLMLRQNEEHFEPVNMVMNYVQRAMESEFPPLVLSKLLHRRKEIFLQPFLGFTDVG